MEKKTRPDTWQIYRDPSTHWRWRRTAPSGLILAASAVGYVLRQACVAEAKRRGYAGA